MAEFTRGELRIQAAIFAQPCGEGAFDDFLLAEEFSSRQLAFQRCSFEGSRDFRAKSDGYRNEADGLK